CRSEHPTRSPAEAHGAPAIGAAMTLPEFARIERPAAGAVAILTRTDLPELLCMDSSRFPNVIRNCFADIDLTIQVEGRRCPGNTFCALINHPGSVIWLYDNLVFFQTEIL